MPGNQIRQQRSLTARDCRLRPSEPTHRQALLRAKGHIEHEISLDERLRIPEDLAIIGCGNLHYDDALRVPLSSVDQQSRRIGEEAARTLRILNSKKAGKPEQVLLEPQLIVRRLNAAPRSEACQLTSNARVKLNPKQRELQHSFGLRVGNDFKP